MAFSGYLNKFRGIILATVLGVATIFALGTVGNYTVPPPIVCQAIGAEVWLDGEKATVRIDAQEKADIGELVRLDVSSSVANSFKWLLVPSSVDFEVYDNGQRAVFSARAPGEYMFIVACAYQDTVDVATHTVTVEGVVPGPGDNGEVPVVEKPDTGAKIADMVPYWCSQAKCNRSEAEALSAGFSAIGMQITAGVIKTPEEVVNATAAMTHDALGLAIVKWMPVLENIKGTLEEMNADGTLVTLEQHKEVWLEISKALSDYAKLFDK